MTTFSDYEDRVVDTDKLPPDDLVPVLFGLFGEVGSILTIPKKHHREDDAYTPYYYSAVVEEFGDSLWYFAALGRRLDIRLDDVFAEVFNSPEFETLYAASSSPNAPLAGLAVAQVVPDSEPTLLKLGEAASELFALAEEKREAKRLMTMFAFSYIRALLASKISFSEVVEENVKKVRGRFVDPDYSDLPQFDRFFPKDQQIPDTFEIVINQRASGRSYLQMNGVFIGDPLTDNIAGGDDYRFHDVFHLAHAAVLHWSPVFRALIKHKRKRDPVVDEAQDGGRAIVVEEGLTAWIFSRAKEQELFDGMNRLSFDLLKSVQQIVAGYEVEQCPMRLWEKAILDGYSVFREVQANSGGRIIGDRKNAHNLV